MPITAAQSNEARDDGGQSTAGVPEWMIAKRQRRGTGEPVAEPAREAISTEFTFTALPPVPPAVRPRGKSPVVSVTPTDDQDDSSNRHGLTRWISKQGVVALAVSLLVHSVILVCLAFIVISNVSTHDGLSIFGVVGDADQNGEQMVLDTAMDVEAGEAAPLEFSSDVAQALEGIGPASGQAEAIRIGSGGKGHGEGEGGDGMSAGVGNLKIPGHAQTKGSFSAWAEPRDPKPGQDYFIVIQIKLPAKYKKYKGSDLSGLVVGTDTYTQKIRYEGNQTFPVDDGNVQFRIRVPGAARLVRDTIRVESKMLHEKQTFEIEF